MNFRYPLSLLTLLASTLLLTAQPDESTAPESGESRDLGFSRARDTISEVDARFQVRQNEVLEDEQSETDDFETDVSETDDVVIGEPTGPVEPAGDADESVVGTPVPEASPGEEETSTEDEVAIDEMADDETLDEERVSEGTPEEEMAGEEVTLEDSDRDETPGEGDESDLELPDSIDSDAVEVDDVYMDFGEAEQESTATREADTISVDFPDEDVRTIIRDVADLYELNVVIPDTLVGSVSLKLRDVSWRQVFDVVLEPLNFTWIEDRNIIKIKSRDELLAEPVATRVYVINFARAGELQNSVAPLVDAAAGGRLQVDTRSNALVITERPSRMNDIQAIIERLDRPTDQVMIESKFVEITRRDTQDLGINWSSLGGYQLNAGPFQREYEAERGRESLEGSTFREGTIFDPTQGEFATDFADTTERSVINTDNVARLDTAVFSADAFSVILSALESNNDVELVSNPTVVTVNNAPAQINIGEEYPIPSYTYNDEQGSFEVSGFEYKPIGIILNVTPQVNSAGFINLNIAPEISSRTDEVTFGGASGATIPIITTRKTESTVTIKSGFTLAIGGLMETRTADNSNNVPLLGDIPFLGRLFQSSSDSVDTRNLIIFITAKVLNPDGSTYRDVFSEKTLLEMGISDNDVPGYEPTPEEQELYKRVREERNALEEAKNRGELQRQLELLEQSRIHEVESADIEPGPGEPADIEPEPTLTPEPNRPRRFQR